MFFRLCRTLGALSWVISASSRLANAACECGYSVNQTSDVTGGVYTELMENDFVHSQGSNLTEFGWRPQEYNVSAKDSRGPYGKAFWVKNADLNPLKDASAWTGEGVNGGDAGLQLWVRGDHSQGFVSSAELASVRQDAIYGSFRVGMKMASQNGTCGAFFWFFNNSQEIDMEFLSKQFNASGGVVNLVLQSPESVRAGYDASNTPNYRVESLPFQPDEDFHEYRFDWSPGSVVFFVDGQFVYKMTQNIPSEAGRFFFNHWSNGDPLWSAGPPQTDTVMTISYMKAYFNSSDAAREKQYQAQCPKFDLNKVCPIPDQNKAPQGANAKTYFFSGDGGNKTPGQTTFRTTNGVTGLRGSFPVWTVVLAAFVAWVVA